ncbi:MAG: DUF4215 domain-containing protein [Polyangiaceae bacterium]|nr:DUF4215 domain-containing protein [Polyangiaceae bacterium]
MKSSPCLRAAPRSVLPSLALAAIFTTACSIDTTNLFGDDAAGGEGQGAGPGAGGSGNQGPGGGSNAGGGNQGGAGQGGDPGTGGVPATGGSTASGAVCGDGVKNGVEECDADDLGGLDCTDFGSQVPAGLDCTGGCTITTAGCVEPSDCGNGDVENGEDCDDANSEPYDGCDECKVNGTCEAAIQISLGAGTTTIAGDTTNGPDILSPGNAGNCQGAMERELVFAITPMQGGFFTAYLPSAEADFDSVLYASPSCPPAGDFACHDNYGTPGDNGGEVIGFRVQPNTTFYLVVDGYQMDDLGAFQLELDLSAGDACGDPVPVTVEGDAPIDLYGDTSGLASNGGSGALCGFAGGGPDVVYQVETPQSDSYDFDLFATYNSVLHARSSCEDVDSQLACSSPAVGNNSDITVSLDGGDTTYVWVDGVMNASGFYTLRIDHGN